MARDDQSYIFREGTTPNTRAAISSRIKVFSFAFGRQGWSKIGVISSFTHTDSRPVDPIRGIGFGDQIAELVPGVSEPVAITAERAALYLSNLFQVFGYAGGIDGLVRALKHHRWPFDIKQEMVISELAAANIVESAPDAIQAASGILSPGSVPLGTRALITVYEACWMNSFSYSLAQDTAIILETADISVSDILDAKGVYGEFIPSGNQPIVVAGSAAGLQGSRRFDTGVAPGFVQVAP